MFPSPETGSSSECYWLLLWMPSQTSSAFFFFPFQNMLEIISKHASDACIFSFTYTLIVTSWRASKVSYKLSISPALSVFSDHFPFAIRDSDHSLTQTETSIRNPKGGQKPPALAAEGASWEPDTVCFRAVAATVTRGTGNTHQHPVSPSPTSFASVPLSTVAVPLWMFWVELGFWCLLLNC